MYELLNIVSQYHRKFHGSVIDSMQVEQVERPEVLCMEGGVIVIIWELSMLVTYWCEIMN